MSDDETPESADGIDPAAAGDDAVVAETVNPEPTSEPAAESDPTAPPVGDAGDGAAPRRGGSAAAAAARARRIGGRPVVPRADDTATTAGASAGRRAEPVSGPVSLGKRSGRQADATSAATSGRSGGDKAARKAEKAADRATKRAAREEGVAATSVVFQAATSSGARDSAALLRWVPAAVLVVAAIVMAIVVAVSTHGSRWARPSSNAERDQVLAAAKSCVVATNTYTYKNLDAFEKKGLACATGPFATQFKNSVDKILRKGAPPVKQVQTLQVNTAGLISVSHSDQWDVLVYGQISVTNTSTTSQRIDPFGAVAHLKKVGGHWRVSSLCSQSLGGTTDSCY